MRALILSFTLVAGLAVGIVSSNFGCDSADAAFDCHAVCQKYKDCVDTGYDVGKCSDNCRTASAHDNTYRAKADTCEACISDRSCTGAAFACTTECAAIIIQ